jgi:hypothetical protein
LVGDQTRDAIPVQHVEAGVARRAVEVVGTDVRGDDLVGAMLLRQCGYQFTADLAVGADDEDAFHRVP